MNEPLKIDPEFQRLIADLSDEEFSQLRENILEDGEVLSPIITWNGLILDGHNRWKIIQENPGIPYRTTPIILRDRYEAIEWILKNQLGRRNITPQERKNLIGKLQTARKQSHGNNAKRDDESGQYLMVQNEPSGQRATSTAEAIGREFGVSPSFVKRAEKFAKGVDALSEVSKEAASKVLRGKSGVSDAEVATIQKMNRKEREDLADRILNPSPKPQTQKERKEESIAEPDYSIEDLLVEINSNAENFVKYLTTTLLARRTCYQKDEKRERVFNALEEIKHTISKLQVPLATKKEESDTDGNV